MEEIGIAFMIIGSLLLCGVALWLAIRRVDKKNVLPILGAALFSLTLTGVGISMWLVAGIGIIEEDVSNAPERKSISGAGGSVISLAREEVAQPEDAP